MLMSIELSRKRSQSTSMQNAGAKPSRRSGDLLTLPFLGPKKYL